MQVAAEILIFASVKQCGVRVQFGCALYHIMVLQIYKTHKKVFLKESESYMRRLSKSKPAWRSREGAPCVSRAPSKNHDKP